MRKWWFSVGLFLILLPAFCRGGTDRWTFIGPAGVSVRALAVDPVSPNVLFAACDKNSGGYNYRSVDYGRTWSLIDIAGELYPQVGNWVIDPVDHRTVYASSNRGLFRSTDEGVTWVAVGPRTSAGGVIDIHRVQLKPGDNRTVYLISQGNALLSGRSFYRSTDGGSTWATTAEFSEKLRGLATDPQQPDLVYVTVDNQGLWRSTDSGLTFVQLAGPPTSLSQPLFVDPGSSRLYLGLSFSDDGGVSWEYMQKPSSLGLNEVTGIVSLPSSPGTLYIGTRWEGLWRSTDGGDSWTAIPTGASTATSVTQIVFFPDHPDWMLVGCEFVGILRSEDAGENWSFSSSGLPCLMRIQDLKIGVDERGGPGTLYVATEWGAYRSPDGGGSWQAISNGLDPLGGPYSWVHCTAPDPLLLGGLYAGTAEGLFKSIDSGRSWRPLMNGWFVDVLAHPAAPGQVYTATYEGPYDIGSDSSLAIDPSDPNTAYRAAGSLARTSDGGRSWSLVLDYPVYGVAVDPTDARKIYVGGPNGVLRSNDLGKTWAQTVSTGPVTSVAVDPVRPNVIYSGYYGGVERSVDYGSTWFPLDHAGMSEEVHTLAVDPVDPRVVYAGGTSGGVFQMTVTDVPVTRPHVTIPKAGTRWAAGTIRFLHWIPTGAANQVRIDYSIDGGETYVTVGDAPNTGSYAWAIPPGINSDRCLIKVTEIGAASDICDRSFSIVNCLYYLEPQTLEIGPLGGQRELLIHADGDGGLCDCSATVDSTWMRLLSPAAGKGSRRIAFSVSSNALREPRTGTIRAGGLELQITQEANTFFSSETGLVFPVFRQDALTFTGISLSGFLFEGPLEFDAFGADGNLLPLSSNPWLTWVQPGEIFTRLASELVGASAVPQSGWLRALSYGDAGLNTLFFVGNPERMDGGVPQKTLSKSMTFSRVVEGPAAFHGKPAHTWISIVNPGAEAGAVQLTLDDPFATPPIHLQQTHEIPERGCLQGSISELFGVTSHSGYLGVQSVNENSQGFYAYGLIELPDALVSLPPASASTSYGSEATLYSAQFAVAPDLFSDLKLVNRENRPVDAVLTWIDDSGKDLAPPVTISLPAGGVYQATAETAFGVGSAQLMVGTLKVRASEGVTGDVIFGTRDLGTAAGVQLKAPRGAAVFNHVANGLGCYTGLAIVNPNTSPITVHVKVYSTDGTKTAETAIPLAPGERRARLVDEWCPETKGQVGGYIELDSGYYWPFCAQQLFGNGFFLAAVPSGY